VATQKPPLSLQPASHSAPPNRPVSGSTLRAVALPLQSPGVVAGAVAGRVHGEHGGAQAAGGRGRAPRDDVVDDVLQLADQLARIGGTEVIAATVDGGVPGVVHGLDAIPDRKRPSLAARAQRGQIIGIIQRPGHAQGDHELHRVLPGGRIVGRVVVDLRIRRRIRDETRNRCAGDAGGFVGEVRRHVVGQVRAQILGPVIKRDIGQGWLVERTRDIGENSACGSVHVVSRAIGQSARGFAGEERAWQCRGVITIPITIGHQHVEVLPAGQIGFVGARHPVPIRIFVGELLAATRCATFEEFACADGGFAIRRPTLCWHLVNPVEELAARRAGKCRDRRAVLGQPWIRGRIAVDVLVDDADVVAQAAEHARQRAARHQIACVVISPPIGPVLILAGWHRHGLPVRGNVQIRGVHRAQRADVHASLESPVVGPIADRIRGRAGTSPRAGEMGRTRIARVERTVAPNAIVPDSHQGGIGIGERGTVLMQRRRVDHVGVVVHAVHGMGAQVTGRRYARIDHARAAPDVAPASIVERPPIAHEIPAHRPRIIKRHGDVGIDALGQIGRRGTEVHRVIRGGPRGYAVQAGGKREYQRQREGAVRTGDKGAVAHGVVLSCSWRRRWSAPRARCWRCRRCCAR